MAGGTRSSARSAEVPAVSGLQELRSRSANIGQLDLVVFRPHVHEYTHSYGKGHIFRCMLVSAQDPTLDCMCELKS